MKTIKRLLAITLSIGLIVVLSGFSMANDPAVVIRGESGCNIFGNNVPFHSVSNHAGNTTLICKGKNIFAPGNAQQLSGFLCGTFLGPTTNSFLAISASGNATLRCQIKN